MINGIINVFKEQGFTSHDVVAKLRGILHQKKIGHTGTLDPDAVGVLPVCLGNGTKLCDLLTDTDKVYRASMILGMTTDTQDTSGEISGDCMAVCTEDDIRRAVNSFIGEYDQIPPMYSAIKIKGRKLYELAREGKEVQRPPRKVKIHEITIEEIEPVLSLEDLIGDKDKKISGKSASIPFKCMPSVFPKVRITMSVCCSKGTYIRTLCHDIGVRLGTGGCMSALERTKVGIFTIENAMTLSSIEKSVADGSFHKSVLPVDSMFSYMPSLTVNDFGERLLHNGNPLPENVFTEVWDETSGDGILVRVYDCSGNFTAIYSYNRKHREFKTVKMFL